MNINWYPGHMVKAKRKMQDELKLVHLVVHVLDARIPQASYNPETKQLFSGKTNLLVLNKRDLADEQLTGDWVNAYRKEDVRVLPFSVQQDSRKLFIARLEESAKLVKEKYAKKGMQVTVRCMITGIPNSGKSTIINFLCGGAKVKAENRPGVTKSNQWINISPALECLDTPGVLWPKLEDQQKARYLCYTGAIKDAVVDVEELACAFLEDVRDRYSQRIEERYRIAYGETGAQTLEAICQTRGFLLKGNEIDYLRGANTLLEEFRSGKLGRMTLELPEG